MAHEISMFNGKAEAAFAMQPAWHGLGTVLDYAPNAAEMIRQAHLDWRVSMIPVQTVDGREVPDTYANCRDDIPGAHGVLGTVSGQYKVVQNSEAFAFLDSLVAEGGLRYESAGALRGGRRVWVLGRMPEVDDIAEGDESLRYVLFATSHDGSAALQAIPTSVRVVCANTLRIATRSNVGIRHTGDMTSKLAEAKLLMSQYNAGFTLFRDHARLLATKQIAPGGVEEYLRTLFPEPKRAENPRSHATWQRDMVAVRGNLRNPRQALPSINGTWWAALNAVTEHADHGESSYGKKLAARESLFLSRMDGAEAGFKAKALEVAIAMAS
jgi:phage/plasmid-like protein (TIGR03299 family)